MSGGLIYGLFTKADSRCFYVGQSTHFQSRLRGHINTGRFSDDAHFYAILENPVEALRLGEREKHWITHFKKIGFTLENKSIGAECRFRRHRGRYYVLNSSRYFTSERTLREGAGLTLRDTKNALEESAKTKSVACIHQTIYATEKIWLIDLEHAPDWQPSPDYQI